VKEPRTATLLPIPAYYSEVEGSAIAGVLFEPAVAGKVGADVSAGVGDLEVALAVVGGCGGVGGEYVGVDVVPASPCINIILDR